MKQATILCALMLTFCVSRSQVEVGYTTTDIGAEFQWYPAGTISSLHVAFNSKLHNSFTLKFGYNKLDRGDDGEKDEEKGSGWGGGVGYRYYFKPHPYKLFLGIRADAYRMNIDWVQGILTGETKTWTLQPAFEVGYTFIINDQGFVTPYVAAGGQINLKTEGDKVGQDFAPLLGISAGFRF